MPRRRPPPDEKTVISMIRSLCTGGRGGPYILGIGDDAALRRCRCGRVCAITADTLVENVHFSLDTMSLREVGYKSMAVNLSDCAAMGTEPEGALTQIVFPRSVSDIMHAFRELYRGFREACVRWRFPVAGGDISVGPCWMIAVTLLGRTARRGSPLRRRGARPGDGLWVSGNPGESAAGLAALRAWGRTRVPSRYRRLVARHLRPVPRIGLGRALAADPLVHAAIDVSDGIAGDVHTLCTENGLGCRVVLPPLRRNHVMVQLENDLHECRRSWFLYGGGDYELLFAAGPEFRPERLAARAGCTVRNIGRLTARRARTVRGVDGEETTLVPGGWDHVRAAARRKTGRRRRSEPL